MEAFELRDVAKAFHGGYDAWAGCFIGDENGEWKIVGGTATRIVVAYDAGEKSVAPGSLPEGTELLVTDENEEILTRARAAVPVLQEEEIAVRRALARFRIDPDRLPGPDALLLARAVADSDLGGDPGVRGILPPDKIWRACDLLAEMEEWTALCRLLPAWRARSEARDLAMGSERLNVGLRIREAAALRSAGKPRDALDLTETTVRLSSVNVRQRLLLHANRAACWMDLDEVEAARREAGRGYALDTNDSGILAVYSRINAAERRG